MDIARQSSSIARRRAFGFVAGLAFAVAVTAPLLAGTPAQALRQASAATGPCPSAYNRGTVNCHKPTTTTKPHRGHGTAASTSTPTLTIGYAGGTVGWQACGWPAAATGTTVQLYLAGQAITAPGGSEPVQSSGCTPAAQFPLCLAPASYPAVAVDQPYGQADNALRVSASNCPQPVTLVASSSSKSRGALAFTGSDIALLALAACVAIVLGYAIVHLNRQRRRISRSS